MSFTVIANYLIAGCVNNGKISVATDLNTAFTSGSGSNKWLPHESTRYWKSIATSADGTKLAACDGGDNSIIPAGTGYIYTSADSGVTWTQQIGSGSRKWTGISSSSDGTILAACSTTIRGLPPNPGYIYVSVDSGVTWTQQLSAGGKSWGGITISSDGTKVAAYATASAIVTGVYSGSWTWTLQFRSPTYPTVDWFGITSSSDGNIIYACERTSSISPPGGKIWKSTDTGVTWAQTGSSTQYWAGVTTTANGSKVAAYVADLSFGSIYVSTNSGTDFSGPYISTNITPYSGICYSSDGLVLAACRKFYTSTSIGSIYVSGNDGVSFTEQTTAGTANWYGITVSGPIAGVCFRGTTRIVMGDLSFKAIKDIERGDEVLIDKKTGVTKKVARIIRFMSSGPATRIPMHLIGNRRTIVCSSNHPFWVSDTRRILAGDIEGVEEIQISEVLYTIQFEEEGTYYVEGVKVDAVSPDHRKHKLPKELYFDQTKYKANRMMKSEDDERRKKPNMVKNL